MKSHTELLQDVQANISSIQASLQYSKEHAEEVTDFGQLEMFNYALVELMRAVKCIEEEVVIHSHVGKRDTLRSGGTLFLVEQTEPRSSN